MKNQAAPPSARKKNGSLYFAVGLTLSITLVTMAFEWNFRNDLTDRPIELSGRDPINQSDMEPVVLPTPPRPKVPVHISTVPDHQEISTEKKDPDPQPFPDIEDEPLANIDELFGSAEPGETAATVNDDEVFFPAEPVGGFDHFYNYLYRNIHFPEHLKGRNITGKVFVAFEIDKNGKISKVEILKGFDARLEKEIIRVLKNAPAWTPAQQGGRKVSTIHNIPFSFEIE